VSLDAFHNLPIPLNASPGHSRARLGGNRSVGFRHVVFMDIGMPGMNGLEAARRIRRLALARQPLICALTGWGQQADRESSHAAGIDRHLVKPIDRDTLQSVLAQMSA
jgi:CheY-like chemotaxis protein